MKDIKVQYTTDLFYTVEMGIVFHYLLSGITQVHWNKINRSYRYQKSTVKHKNVPIASQFATHFIIIVLEI